MENQIIFLCPTDGYLPGGTIIGKIAFTLERRENIKSVQIELKGKESTKWSEDVTYHDRTINSVRQGPVSYYGINRIIQSSQELRTPGSDGPGDFEYPFEFSLPRFLPSTYEGEHGTISYYLKATVHLTDGLILYREVRYVVIKGPINLCNLPDYNLEPVHVSDENIAVACCTSLSGVAKLDLNLPKQFYTLDETIPTSIHITNQSGANIHNVDMELTKIIMEKVTTPDIKTKYRKEVIDSKTGAGVPKGTRNTYDFSFNISQTVIVNNFGYAKLFKEWFLLRVVARMEDNEPLVVETPLIVGHINEPNLTTDVDGNRIDHMSVPGGTPYPPLPDFMSIPGRTPYPPPLATAPQEEIHPSAPRVLITQEVPESPPPSYHEVVSNPKKYSPNSNKKI